MANIGKKSSIQDLLESNKLKAKKKYGQNFLVDQNILRNIVRLSEIDKESNVIEIGPGLGSLTEVLIHASKKVLAYEIDKDFIPILQQQFENENFAVIEDDFLKRDVDQDIERFFYTEEIVVVSNLPYYITTPIIFKILEETNKIHRMVLMMQLEVANRMTSKPSTKDYNALSVIIQYKTHAKFGMKIPRSVFIPAPNVDSAVIVLDKKDTSGLVIDERHFISFVKAAFTQRRKTLVNNIYNFFDTSKREIMDDLERLGYKETIRAEKCDVQDFMKMHSYFYKKYCS